MAGAVVLGLASTTLVAGAAQAAPVQSCPTAVSSSVVLGADLPGCVLAVWAGNVTVDLGGHLIGGVEIGQLPAGSGAVTIRNGRIDARTVDPQFPGDAVSSTAANLRLTDLTITNAVNGINALDGTIRIESVTVRDSGTGAVLSGVRASTVVNSTFRDNSAGLLLSYATGTTVAVNQFTNNEFFGLRLDSATDSTVTGNYLTTNGVGLDTAAAGNERVTIAANIFTANKGRGVDLTGASGSLRIEYNAANANGGGSPRGVAGDAGISVNVEPIAGHRSAASLRGNLVTSNAGLGISANGTVDGGGNVAANNGDPAQCAGVAC
jgi:parallel beta-helix repeat protein